MTKYGHIDTLSLLTDLSLPYFSFLSFLHTVLVITQPKNKKVTVGDKNVDIFTIKASGCCLVYEWQKKYVENFNTVQRSRKKRTYKMAEVKDSDAGRYKCRVTSSTVVGGGGEDFSNEVTLIVGKCILST